MEKPETHTPCPAITPVTLDVSTAADVERYRIESPAEIAFTLRTVIRRRSLASVYLHDGNDFFLTVLLELDTASGRLVFDAAPSAALNRRLLEAKELVLVTSQDGIKIQFACDDARKIRFGGRYVFSVALPDSLLRVQRRAYFRIATPPESPLVCAIPLPAGKGSAELTVLDISCGGIGVIDHHPEIHLEPGAVYRDCSLVLPDAAAAPVALQVRSSYEHTLANGVTCKRAGCEFTGVAEGVVRLLQRYITALERERNRKRNAWE